MVCGYEMTDAPVESRDDDDERLDDDTSSNEQAAPPAIDPAPRWIVDLRRSQYRRGFYKSLGDYALQFTDRGNAVLVVSFDNLSAARDDSIGRDSWGYSFVAKNGWSHLGVLTFAANWFRDKELFAELRAVVKSGFFRRFDRIFLTGTSMGGYAACAFASLVPGCTVLAFSPQASLNKDLVPWEKRFSAGRKMDWSGDFANAAQETGAAAQVWLVYDPKFKEDRKHVEMFSGPNIRLLKARHAGHKTALILRRANILSTVVRETAQGEMTEARFYQHYRSVRHLPWFVNTLADAAFERNRYGLTTRLVHHLRERGQGFLGHKIRQKQIELSGTDPLSAKRPGSGTAAGHKQQGAPVDTRPQ